MSIVTLFVAILGVLFISIVITVINWIFQSRLSARITLLEKELEKKTLEFDTLRKERGGQPAQSEPRPFIDVPAQADMPLEQESIDDGSIKIFRNVRGTFAPAIEESVEATHVDDTDSGIQGWQHAIDRDDTGYASYTADQNARQDSTCGMQDQTAPSLRPVTPGHAQAARESFVAIPLLAASGQGADFNLLYQQLCEILNAPLKQNLAFDCGGIQFLSGPELEYLEKIHQSLAAQNRPLALINCSSSLAALLRQRPNLASLVR
ncbi:MAG: hypothetical protein JW768_01270 [Chitinispirillaceae bacterium]|nr:hypothetical protein [Chitinispirillaceae bacterium]